MKKDPFTTVGDELWHLQNQVLKPLNERPRQSATINQTSFFLRDHITVFAAKLTQSVKRKDVARRV